MKFLPAAVLPVALFGSAIQYSDQSAWNAAVSDVATIDFDSYAGIEAPEGLTIDGVHFAGMGYSWGREFRCSVASKKYSICYDAHVATRETGVQITTRDPYVSDDQYLRVLSNDPREFTIRLPQQVTAFAFDFSGPNYAYVSTRIRIDNAGPEGPADPYGYLLKEGFNGFVSADPVGEISFTSFPDYRLNGSLGIIGIDDFSFGLSHPALSSAVPEPGTMWTVAFCILALAGTVRSRRNFR